MHSLQDKSDRRVHSSAGKPGKNGVALKPPLQLRAKEEQQDEPLSALFGQDIGKFHAPVQRTKITYNGSEVGGTDKEVEPDFWNYLNTNYGSTQDDLYKASVDLREEFDALMNPTPWDKDIKQKLQQRISQAIAGNTVKKDVAPSTTASAVVPELPDAEAQQWTTDMAQETNRKRVAEEIITYLVGQGVFNTAISQDELVNFKQSFDNVKSTITVVYNSSLSQTARTEYKRKTGETNAFTSMTMTFSKEAFDNLPKLYSTIRHELIHVGQYLMTPDPVTSEDDLLMYELGNEWTKKNVSGKGNQSVVLNKIRKGLMEVETHVWEIEKSPRTGTSTDIAFLSDTYHFVFLYLDNFVLDGSRRITMAVKRKVKGHLLKCQKMVADFLNSPLLLNQTDLLVGTTYAGKTETEARNSINTANQDLLSIINGIT